jgi:hypothetical protein
MTGRKDAARHVKGSVIPLGGIMLTSEEIEGQEYSTNDVADLLMRLQTARSGLEYAATEIMKTETNDSLVMSAYEALINTLGMIDCEHDCEINPDDNGIYRCACGLIASAENGA